MIKVQHGQISIEPQTPGIGALVSGANLTKMDDAQFEMIEQALTDHLVLFFRDQAELAPGLQIEFAKRFGNLHIHPAAPHLPGHPEIFVIHTHQDSKIANGNGWHTDVSCDAEPPLATMLQMHTLPSSGGDTLFANMFQAYETLSESMQTFLQGLTATHGSEHIYRGRYGVDDQNKVYPSSHHPIVRTHPKSGRQALYVNPSFTTGIDQLNTEESKVLLEMLFKHQQRPEFQVRFNWSQDAIALWDNRCTQHFAMWDYWPEERKGHRVTIAGEAPYMNLRQPIRVQSPPNQPKLSRRL